LSVLVNGYQFTPPPHHYEPAQSLSMLSISEPTSQAQFQCLYQAGYSRPVIQIYANGQVNSAAYFNVQAAIAAWTVVQPNPQFYADFVFVPCPTCDVHAAMQGARAIDPWTSCNGAGFENSLLGAVAEYFWIVVQNPQDWLGSKEKNRQWLHQVFFDAGTTMYPTDYGDGVWATVTKLTKVGILTTKADWQAIIGEHHQSLYGDNFIGLVWYVGSDDTANFDDFQPFGGWTTPTMKTVNEDVTMCSVVGDEAFFYTPSYYTAYRVSQYPSSEEVGPYLCENSFPNDYYNGYGN